MLTLRENSYNWALNHALKLGDTDVFPVPFEYQALQYDWNNVKSQLVTTNVLDWKTRPMRSLLSPKAKYGFRTITQLDPLDFLIYSALIYEIASELEFRRVPVGDQIVFSYRVSTKQDGQLFDIEVGYRQYLARCREKLAVDTACSYVAVTDISDFYSRIYHHRLENALRAATSSNNHVTSLMRLLSGWNGTETFGIPVGCAPSRLLAEIALSDVDEAMRANGIDFVRFNDDYRIFATSETMAYQHLTFLASTLTK